MSGGGSDQKSEEKIVGFRYFVGVHMALCHGVIDDILNIKVNERVAWSGTIPVNRTGVLVSNKNLFGGLKKEGGIIGPVDFPKGEPDQQISVYLRDKMAGGDSKLPAFRGVSCAVLEHVEIGTSSYMKPWAFTPQRIHKDSNGGVQWYDEKAAIQGALSGYIGIPSPNNTPPVILTLGLRYGTTDDVHFQRQKAAALAFLEKLKVMLASGELNGFSLCISCYGAQYVQSIDGGSCDTRGYPAQGYLSEFWKDMSVTDVDTAISWLGSKAPFTDTYVNSFNVALYGLNEIGTYTDPDDGARMSIVMGWELPSDQYPPCLGLDNDVLANASETTDRAEDRRFSVDSDNYAIFVTRDFGESGWYLDEACTDDNGNKGAVPTLHATDADLGSDQLLAMVLKSIGLTNPYEPVESYSMDMNPIHIIRECLTDSKWGMGYASADIDDTSFMAAADTLYTEGMGMSLLWSTEVSLEEFIQDVLRHVNGILYVDLITGKFTIKLLRDDYDIATLPVLNEDTILTVTNLKRATDDELINTIVIVYHDNSIAKDTSLTIKDQARIAMNGYEISTTVQYPGFTYKELASKVALRDLTVLSTALLSCTLQVNRYASNLTIGGVFVLDWPDLNVDAVIMRITGLDFGDGTNNTISIECIEDIFGFPEVVLIPDDPDDPGWTDPSRPPVDTEYRLVQEMPYYGLVLVKGETVVNTALNSEPLGGQLMAAAVNPNDALNADLYTSIDNFSFVNKGNMNFCGTALLAFDLNILNEIFYTIEMTNIDQGNMPTWVQIDNELMRVDSAISNIATTGRGILDTPPRNHAAGARLYFWKLDRGLDPTEYLQGEIVYAKILPTTGQGTLPIYEASVESMTFNQRAYRPYAPGNFQVDGVLYPYDISVIDPVLTWSHRDRLQQTSGDLFDHTAGNIGPEAGVTYTIRVYDSLDVEQLTITSIAATTHTLDTSTLIEGEKYTLRLYAVRGGLDCWSPVEWEFRGSDGITQVTYKTISLISEGNITLPYIGEV